MTTFSESKDGIQWWSNFDKVLPYLDVYCDSFMKGSEIVACIRDLAKDVERTDANVVVLGQQFQRLWFVAPDSGKIHAYPGWNLICDLASEFSEAL